MLIEFTFCYCFIILILTPFESNERELNSFLFLIGYSIGNILKLININKYKNIIFLLYIIVLVLSLEIFLFSFNDYKLSIEFLILSLYIGYKINNYKYINK